MFLIDNIFSAPAKGFMKILEVIHDEAHNELYNPEKIRQELMQLQVKLEMEEISEEEYDAAEEILLDRLDEAQRMHQ